MKIVHAVAGVMPQGVWMNSTEVSAQLDYSASAVRTALVNMVRSGDVKRKENPAKPGAVLYMKIYAGEGAVFGLSERISAFDRLISEVRA